MYRLPLQLGIPGATELVLVPLVGLVIVVVPTVGMYREAAAHDPDNLVVWTVAMLVLAVLVPLIGPVLLYVLYTFIVVRSDA